MSGTTHRLGRGLGALLSTRPTAEPSAQPASAHPAARMVGSELPLSQIRPNPRQPRRSFSELTLAELAASIRTTGVLQPILVRAVGPEQYELIAGERRWRAAQLAGLVTIPAIIKMATDAAASELALIENLQRDDLSPVERATAYQQYLDNFGGTIEDLAHKLGESRANISNYMRLLKLQADVLAMLASGEIAMGHARAIASLDDPQRQLALARLIARRQLSVRQAEEAAQLASKAAEPEVAVKPAQDGIPTRHFDELGLAFSRALGVKVRVDPGRKRNSGRIVIQYNTLDEFEAIASRLGVRASSDA